MEAILKSAWDNSIWLRGAILAVALVTMLFPMLGINQQEFLGFTHAIIERWDYFLSTMFGWVGNLFPWRADWSRFERNFLIGGTAYFTFYWEFLAKDGTHTVKLAAIMLIWNMALFFLISSATPFEETKWVVWMGTITVGFGTAVLFWTSLSNKRRPALAVFYALTFLAALEFLYHVPLLNDLMGDARELLESVPLDPS